eukprot:scaffold118506_cov20-Prasinocladus_malaysianus.AAC.1
MMVDLCLSVVASIMFRDCDALLSSQNVSVIATLTIPRCPLENQLLAPGKHSKLPEHMRGGVQHAMATMCCNMLACCVVSYHDVSANTILNKDWTVLHVVAEAGVTASVISLILLHY